MSYPLSALAGLDEQTEAALRTASIRTTTTLLERAKDAKGRKDLRATDVSRWYIRSL